MCSKSLAEVTAHFHGIFAAQDSKCCFYFYGLYFAADRIENVLSITFTTSKRLLPLFHVREHTNKHSEEKNFINITKLRTDIEVHCGNVLVCATQTESVFSS